MNAHDVAIYLREHPEFFEEHLDMLSAVKVKHPHGRHAIPLIERQVLALREKSRQLEGSLMQLMGHGEQNDLTQDRIHRMTLDLLAAPHMLALLQAIDSHLRQDFGLDACAVRMWGNTQGSVETELGETSEQVRAFAETLDKPRLSDAPLFDTAAWFSGDSSLLKSFAYVPLRAERPFGLLAFASRDPQRFTPDMGTLYIERLGELVSMALRRFLDL
ncbi:MAG: DUF484 family protein [Betaproteobacteria bacterium]|nr:DUF484 family protein [Betaproteobacteria bacterium]